MDYYAAVDVSLKQSSVGIVDATERIIREAKVPSDCEAVIAFFRETGLAFQRIGLEAGPLSQWLYGGMTEAGLPGPVGS